MEELVIDPKKFHSDIEDIVEKHGCGYIDALLFYQKNKVLEAETVSVLVKKNPLLKAKLHEEMLVVRMVKPSDTPKLTF
mgnify:CR=1 FL=1